MIVGTLVALGVLVTFHEFGHFWVARRCGVKVLRFFVGFGTPLVRWRRGPARHRVRGGGHSAGRRVRDADEREAEVPAHLLEQSFNRKTVRQRIAIVAAGPIANFLLAILFFWVSRPAR
ncbi:site-2 protease family protein [Pseudomonas aeruginosa]